MSKEITSVNAAEQSSGKMPSKDIVDGFSLKGEPVFLEGGQGTCYRVGDSVLKPVQDEVESSWIADINNNLVSNQFRIPKPIKAKDGSWAYKGWTASEFLQGEHRMDNYAELKDLCQVFHQALKPVRKPDWFDKRPDVFALADRMAWGEIPLPSFERANERLKKLSDHLHEIVLENQLIHGDWGPDQILFHPTLPPAVLDLTPYFRPADYPIADMLFEAMVHGDKDISIMELGKNIKDFDQLLLRAIIFRTCTYINFQNHPQNDRDWTDMMEEHLNVGMSVVQKLGI